MKIRNLTKYSKTLLKLKLIKTKIYKETTIFKVFKIEDIEHRIKKSLQIIYKYHLWKKKILFLTSSQRVDLKFKRLIHKTKHKFLSENLLLSGFLTNQQSSKYKNQFDLIIILGKFQNPALKSEIYKLNKPVIMLDVGSGNIYSAVSYKIPGNFLFGKKKVRDNFFLTLTKTILKKKSGLEKS